MNQQKPLEIIVNDMDTDSIVDTIVRAGPRPEEIYLQLVRGRYLDAAINTSQSPIVEDISMRITSTGDKYFIGSCIKTKPIFTKKREAPFPFNDVKSVKFSPFCSYRRTELGLYEGIFGINMNAKEKLRVYSGRTLFPWNNPNRNKDTNYGWEIPCHNEEQATGTVKLTFLEVLLATQMGVETLYKYYGRRAEPLGRGYVVPNKVVNPSGKEYRLHVV